MMMVPEKMVLVLKALLGASNLKTSSSSILIETRLSLKTQITLFLRLCIKMERFSIFSGPLMPLPGIREL